MWNASRVVAAGNLVIVWMNRNSLLPLVVTPGLDLNNRFGVFRHSDFIGVPYGTKVASRNGRGFVYILRPTPELWTLALPHRTQILYIADIAFITTWLSIRPGSVVIEAGTGSASFSHSVARTIGSAGKLHSFEFHQERAAIAKEEFTRHGMSMVTLSHRNVCQQGFGDAVDIADAVFLDLPAPWLAIPHAKRAMKKSHVARICCFSPCLEQVLRTVNALNDSGFADITMYESSIRPHDVYQLPRPITVSEIIARVKAKEVSNEERRLRQIQASRQQNRKRRRQSTGEEPDEDERPSKRRKEDVEEAAQEGTDDLEAGRAAEPSITPRPRSRIENTGHKVPMSKPISEVRGHTSYLTFAVLLPLEISIVALEPGERAAEMTTQPPDPST